MIRKFAHLHLGDVLPKSKTEEIHKLTKLYADLEKHLVRFKNKSALSCPPNCGECCRSAYVSASVFEMQPAAFYLMKRGEDQMWLSKINPDDERATCVFYSSDALANGGHCHIYGHRPFLCRLFGYSARENKRGEKELMLCRRLKAYYADRMPVLKQRSARHWNAPVSTLYLMKASALSRHLHDECININLAFKNALEMIYFYQQIKDKKFERR